MQLPKSSLAENASTLKNEKKTGNILLNSSTVAPALTQLRRITNWMRFAYNFS